MTEAAPTPSEPRPPRASDEAVFAALRRAWRALTARTLVARRGGRDRMRVPLSIAALVAAVLLLWNWPLVVLAIVLALVLRVEFVVVREEPAG